MSAAQGSVEGCSSCSGWPTAAVPYVIFKRVTGLGQSNVSYHLQALREAGLVTATAKGRSNHYQLANTDLDQLSGFIGNLGAPAKPIVT